MATTTATPYTFTEKKRIRKSFAKRAIVQQVPFLLATQLQSYAAFLQEFTNPDQTPGNIKVDQAGNLVAVAETAGPATRT